MSEFCYETRKRLKIVEEEMKYWKVNCVGAVLAGSVAYAPNYNVHQDSDVDLLIVVEEIRHFAHLIFDSKKFQTSLKNRFFEGYCYKKIIDGVPISFHILSEDAFDIITKCFVADIRVFRPQAKNENYNLYGFERNYYKYYIKNVPLSEFEGGVRTIVPIGFINNDRYFLGIHRDKLLSNSVILHDTSEKIKNGIEKLWINISQNLCDESYRLFNNLDLEKMSILNMLSKKEKMPEVVINKINDISYQHISCRVNNRIL